MSGKTLDLVGTGSMVVDRICSSPRLIAADEKANRNGFLSGPLIAFVDLLIGETIDNYEIVRHLGHGGMATVYLAKDLNFPCDNHLGHREVAIKVLPEAFASDSLLLRPRLVPRRTWLV